MITFTIEIKTVENGTGISFNSNYDNPILMEENLAIIVSYCLQQVAIIANDVDPGSVIAFGDNIPKNFIVSKTTPNQQLFLEKQQPNLEKN